ERDESGLGSVRDDARERRLTGAGRPPQDDGLQEIALDRLAQRFARGEQLLLAHELVEGARAHPLGERRRRIGAGGVVRKQGVHGSRFKVRCRRASYTMSAAVTAVLSDSTGGCIGIMTRSSAASIWAAARPAPSPPMRI